MTVLRRGNGSGFGESGFQINGPALPASEARRLYLFHEHRHQNPGRYQGAAEHVADGRFFIQE